MQRSKIISLRRKMPRMLALLSVMILAACAETPTTSGLGIRVGDKVGTNPGEQAPRYVPCLEDPIIPFYSPDDKKPDVKETAANIFDTPDTIELIRRHNAKHREACGK